MRRCRYRVLIGAGAFAANALAFAQDAPSPGQALAPAPAYPAIVEIAFAGNGTTRPSTMLREMVVHVGDPADPARIEKSRQGVQDLGLFRSVTVEQFPVAGGVKLLFTVKEKYYIIPAPRADTNSDGQYAYGVQLRWYNVLGLNHIMRLTLLEKDRRQSGRGKSLSYDASYLAPFVFDTPYGLDLSYAHATETVDASADGTIPAYDEIAQGARAILSRSFSIDGVASHGYRWGGGLQWGAVRNQGEGAPAASGAATGFVVNGAYSDQRFNVYSEAGPKWSFEYALATQRFFSDHAYSMITAHYDDAWYVGDTPHQTVAVFAEGGTYHGPHSAVGGAFQLGGAGDLRGYRHNFLAGDHYYYAGVEALRPIHWDWLRAVVFFESGNAFAEDHEFTVDDSYADAGLGLRVRMTWFVKFELNVGYAWPLKDAGDGLGGRFFATGRR